MASFTEIGKGTFGIIFTNTADTEAGKNTTCILKRTIQPNFDPQNWLRQDAKQHEVISQSLMDVGSQKHLENLILPCVPRFLGLMGPEHSWWSLHGMSQSWLIASEGCTQPEANDLYKTPSQILSAQRIPNIDTLLAQKLLNEYCLGSSDSSAGFELFHDTSLLLRVYFGQNAPLETGSRLHNFPLYRNRLQSLLSVDNYAKALQIMASALAFLHWHVRCDAKDVEFVFGGLNPHVGEQKCHKFELFGEKCHMWLLDFNQVETITMDFLGVTKAVLGYENDPYYPKAHENAADWEVFRDQYLATSQMLLEDGCTATNSEHAADAAVFDLPRMFIEKIQMNAGLNRAQRALNFAMDDHMADDAGLRARRLSYMNVTRALVRALVRAPVDLLQTLFHRQ